MPDFMQENGQATGRVGGVFIRGLCVRHVEFWGVFVVNLFWWKVGTWGNSFKWKMAHTQEKIHHLEKVVQHGHMGFPVSGKGEVTVPEAISGTDDV